VTLRSWMKMMRRLNSRQNRVHCPSAVLACALLTHKEPQAPAWPSITRAPGTGLG
jgi:hypothetical protein